MPTNSKKWAGSTPVICTCCRQEPKKYFVDGKTKFGPWTIMCNECWPQFGVGRLGVGFGQKYDAKTLDKIERPPYSYNGPQPEFTTLRKPFI